MDENPFGEDWHYVGKAAEFDNEDVEQHWVGNLAVAIYKAEGQFYATQDVCTHEHAYLSDGIVVDCVVECPFHQGRFDVRTGEALGAPVIIPLKTYPVQVVDGRIYVSITAEQAKAG